MNSPFLIEPCGKENIKKIIDGLNLYNLGKVPAEAPTWTPLEYMIRDEEGNEIGGVLGSIGYWNGLEIKMLWIAEEYRNEGIGTRLLNHIETVAASKGAVIAMLDTFNFQAEEFYLKNGYDVIGEIKNFPKGHRRIYFSKQLA